MTGSVNINDLYKYDVENPVGTIRLSLNAGEENFLGLKWELLDEGLFLSSTQDKEKAGVIEGETYPIDVPLHIHSYLDNFYCVDGNFGPESPWRWIAPTNLVGATGTSFNDKATPPTRVNMTPAEIIQFYSIADSMSDVSGAAWDDASRQWVGRDKGSTVSQNGKYGVYPFLATRQSDGNYYPADNDYTVWNYIGYNSGTIGSARHDGGNTYHFKSASYTTAQISSGGYLVGTKKDDYKKVDDNGNVSYQFGQSQQIPAPKHMSVFMYVRVEGFAD